MDEIRVFSGVQICLGDYARINVQESTDGIYNVDFTAHKDIRIAINQEGCKHYIFLSNLKKLWEESRRPQPSEETK